MPYINEWHDVLRVIVFLISFGCLITLLRRYHNKAADWNRKTLDYWYSLCMWCGAGCVITAQGIILDRPFTPAVVMVTAAALTTAKGLRRKGDWGGRD